MEKVETYFFDSYALFEILHGNVNYEPYKKNVSVVTTLLNLMELHYRLLREYGKNVADKSFLRFREFCIDVEDEDILGANNIKLKNKSRGLSYVDCIGYFISKRLNIKFLTGDKEFESFENVKFVK